MKLCPKCGIKNQDDEKKCINCGLEFEEKKIHGFDRNYDECPRTKLEEICDKFMGEPSANDMTVLPTLPKWNWASFLGTWLWLMPINWKWSLVWILTVNVITGIINTVLKFMAHLVPFFALPISMAMLAVWLLPRVFLGFYGSELAWKYRQFESAEEFFSVQKQWVIGMLLFYGAVILLGVVGIAFGHIFGWVLSPITNVFGKHLFHSPSF